MGMLNMFAGMGITSILVVSMFGFISILMDSATARTDVMVEDMIDYSENMNKSNEAKLVDNYKDTQSYVRQLSSMSNTYLEKYLKMAEESDLLSEEDKESIREARDMLGRIESEEVTDQDLKDMEEKLDRIFTKLEEVEED